MNTAEHHSSSRPTIDLKDIFWPGTVETFPNDVRKRELLGGLVQSLARAGRVPGCCVHPITDTLLERERYATTGLGKGVALPHARHRDVTSFVGAIGVAPGGVDFASLDGLPTRLIVLLLSPYDQREAHAEILGRLATLFSNKTLQYVVQHPRSAEALLQLLGI